MAATPMTIKRLSIIAISVVAFSISILMPRLVTAQQPPAVPQEQARGPIHEAFGEPMIFDPKPGVVVSKQPPALIEEVPPDQKPEGDNVVWISGYWYWDDERNDYIWISGFWRAVPPARTWVPGYWADLGDGRYQWVAGYWASAATQQVDYLPEPPASLEAGPSTDPPSDDSIWAPGCWVWQTNRYFWRPGYWLTASPDWIWMPAHYCWTPRGYVFVDGFWDYVIARRGLLFAPVFFPRDVLAQANFVYTPSVVVDPLLMTNYLFARPGRQHYYFGDYYLGEYLKAGIFPWFAYHNSRYGYDPLYAHAAWTGRKDSNWLATQRQTYWDRRDHEANRPPHTFAEMQKLARRPNANVAHLQIAKPLAEVAKQKDHTVKLQQVDGQRLKQFSEHAGQIRGVQQDRAKWEAQRTTAQPKVEPNRPKVEPKPMAQTPQRWQMPKPPSAVASPRVQPTTPAHPQVPQHHAEPPKITQQPLPHPEDLLKHPQPKAQPPKPKK
jgi:hypothetical protein